APARGPPARGRRRPDRRRHRPRAGRLHAPGD
ncbi:MAG: Transcriptional regulator, AsnC family, partial [uncultured Quadrisphaera sp.]